MEINNNYILRWRAYKINLLKYDHSSLLPRDQEEFYFLTLHFLCFIFNNPNSLNLSIIIIWANYIKRWCRCIYLQSDKCMSNMLVHRMRNKICSVELQIRFNWHSWHQPNMSQPKLTYQCLLHRNISWKNYM